MFEYLIGVDGGGSGTRVRILRADGNELGRGRAGPSGLAHGIDNAWATVLDAVDSVFAEARVEQPARERLAIGLGLAGAHNQGWAAEFSGENPGFGGFVLATDAFCTLLGAHRGEPGAVVASGTGSVGEALLADGTRVEVGGWGFPAGDEGSGAWLGLHAVNHAQRVLDGRRAPGELAGAVIDYCGGGRQPLFAWQAHANQTSYAELAPLVIKHAARDDEARALMIEAGNDIADIAHALDRPGQLPIALCGGLAAAMIDYLPAQLRKRVVKPHAEAVDGALQLARRALQGK